MEPPNSRHPKYQIYLKKQTKRLVPNVTAFAKLPPNSGYLSITGNFFKTRVCPIFRGFTVLLFDSRMYSNLILDFNFANTMF